LLNVYINNIFFGATVNKVVFLIWVLGFPFQVHRYIIIFMYWFYIL
jgi:hypothetical protein